MTTITKEMMRTFISYAFLVNMSVILGFDIIIFRFSFIVCNVTLKITLILKRILLFKLLIVFEIETQIL